MAEKPSGRSAAVIASRSSRRKSSDTYRLVLSSETRSKLTSSSESAAFTSSMGTEAGSVPSCISQLCVSMRSSGTFSAVHGVMASAEARSRLARVRRLRASASSERISPARARSAAKALSSSSLAHSTSGFGVSRPFLAGACLSSSRSALTIVVCSERFCQTFPPSGRRKAASSSRSGRPAGSDTSTQPRSISSRSSSSFWE